MPERKTPFDRQNGVFLAKNQEAGEKNVFLREGCYNEAKEKNEKEKGDDRWN